MRQFYFHLHGPAGCERDDLGVMCEGAEAAYLHACRAIPDLAADLLRERRNPMHCAFEITDANGRTILDVPFAEVLKEPASRGEIRTRIPAARSAGASRHIAEKAYRSVFAYAPHAYLILSTDLRIVGANPSYTSATDSEEDALAGRFIFDAFPDNPETPEADGVKMLAASLDRALARGKRDVMRLQRYDVRGRDGRWYERWWRPMNWPVHDDEGATVALVHHAVDVTAEVLASARRPA